MTEQIEKAAPRREPALIGEHQREQQEREGVSMSLESSASELVGYRYGVEVLTSLGEVSAVLDSSLTSLEGVTIRCSSEMCLLSDIGVIG